jgi:hypothetical protein
MGQSRRGPKSAVHPVHPAKHVKIRCFLRSTQVVHCRSSLVHGPAGSQRRPRWRRQEARNGGRRATAAAGDRQEGQRRRQGGWSRREQIADGESRAPEATGRAAGASNSLGMAVSKLLRECSRLLRVCSPGFGECIEETELAHLLTPNKARLYGEVSGVCGASYFFFLSS